MPVSFFLDRRRAFFKESTWITSGTFESALLHTKEPCCVGQPDDIEG